VGATLIARHTISMATLSPATTLTITCRPTMKSGDAAVNQVNYRHTNGFRQVHRGDSLGVLGGKVKIGQRIPPARVGHGVCHERHFLHCR
jgi:hypothetical protein